MRPMELVSSPNERTWPVSISTVALMPTRSGGSPASLFTSMRTEMRCTTFTQLPDAFCGGSTANSAPVACAMLTTVPCQTRSG